MEKTKVNGPEASMLFKVLRNNSELFERDISWNFGKFLVNVEKN